VIGLDTNILVRYFTEDDPAQARRAARLIEQRLTADAPGHVSCVALAELVWVLTRSYRSSRETIVEIVDGMLASPALAIEHKTAVRRALQDYRQAGADFSDCLIAHVNADAGCEATLTFDRAAAKRNGFRLLTS
jgi:predicted nucleic-acid-binding protein